ncbi:hypothetical protein ALC60_02700 [Trachymyrmex zeteki]|uniref:Uncharacterized protein n=1 Tax=Mycetomoellerius zeteki TaxID=64791 RepID=A0A151XD81_9HYME|nr:hypothetical protein ALC60_02700 [Trachymyrmex zeteki]
MPYSVLEARTKDEFETDDLSPSRERRHMQERKREKERRGENGRKGGKRATRRESVTGERGKKEIIRTRRGEERAIPLLQGGEEGKGRNNALRESPGAAAIDRRCQFSNSFSLLSFFLSSSSPSSLSLSLSLSLSSSSSSRASALTRSLAVIPLLFVHPSRDSPRERPGLCRSFLREKIRAR